MQLTVPRRGGWRAWGTVRADFEQAPADSADPAIVLAEIASGLRRGAGYVRVTVTLTVAVAATDLAGALAIAWEAFLSAAGDDLTGWESAGAAAQIQPAPPLTCARAGCQSAGAEAVLQLHPAARASMSPRSCPVMAIASWARVPAISSNARPYSPTSMKWCSSRACSLPIRSSRLISRPYSPPGQLLVVSRVYAITPG